MGQRAPLGGDHLAGRESLLVVDVAEDPIHQVDVGYPAVSGGVADHGHEVVGARRLGKGDRRHRRGTLDLVDAEEGQVWAVRVLDMEDLQELERQAVRTVDLLEEVDRGAHETAARALPKDEARSATATELGGHVPIGHDGVRSHEPARAEPRQAVPLDLDPADRLRGSHEVRPGSREPCRPHGAVGIVEGELRLVLLDRQDGAAGAHHDRLDLELTTRQLGRGPVRAAELVQLVVQRLVAISHRGVGGPESGQRLHRSLLVDSRSVDTR